ncbi:hypothetical protein ACFC25_10015 [Pseudarthrobacter sp. NPDC055928]|uniref:hypothetical protein n=1 Tax=Pseudarthrobacter sp. NPDC055928 TaxID=3345661 RepID=UPI0035E1D791
MKPNVEKLLLENRQALSQAAATVRAINTRRNQQIADALWDGVLPTAVASATGTSLTAVRTIGLSYDDMLPQGAHKDAHVATLLSTATELQNAEADKARLEHQRYELIVTAQRLGTYDDYQIAALTGISAPEIKRMVRGTKTSQRKAGSSPTRTRST